MAFPMFGAHVVHGRAAHVQITPDSRSRVVFVGRKGEWFLVIFVRNYDSEAYFV